MARTEGAKTTSAKNLPASREIAESPPAMLLSDAVKAGASIEVLERLMALQERWDSNQARRAFNVAMADARIELPSIMKNRSVDFTSPRGRTNYRYEDLHAVTEALAPILAKYGLSFRWRTDTDKPDVVKVTCIVSHRDGHSEETTLTASNDHSGNKNDIQSLGSAVTYLQRYTLKAAFGVAAAYDDDGNNTTGDSQDRQSDDRNNRQSSAHDNNPANRPGYDAAMKADQEAQQRKGEAQPRNKAHDHLEETMKEWATKKNKTVEESFLFLQQHSSYTRPDGSIRPATRVVLDLTEKEAIICRRAFEDDIKYGDTNWRMELSNRVLDYVSKNPKADKVKILKDLTGLEDWKQVSQQQARVGVNKFDKTLAEKGKK